MLTFLKEQSWFPLSKLDEVKNEFARPILASWYGMYDMHGTARDCGF